jgi:hypothetical protein
VVAVKQGVAQKLRPAELGNALQQNGRVSKLTLIGDFALQ